MEHSIFLLALMLAHWLGDFYLQTDEMAQNKSKSNKVLTKHVAIYTTVVSFYALILAFIGFYIFGKTGIIYLPLFIIANFALHWCTDYITSRIAGNFYKAGKRHKFFATIGMDQFIHFASLWLTLWLIV